MSESELREVDRSKLPWFYRLILRVPGTDFLESSGGIFWGIIMPILFFLNWFLCWFLLLSFPFPTNIILTAITPVAVFMIFAKISLKRFLNWWNSSFGKSRFEWNVEKIAQEYFSLLKKKEDKNERK
jgi:hypothetical protein